MSIYGVRFAKAIAKQLQEQKQKAGKTNQDIADVTGTSPVTVLRYLKGQRTMPIDVFADICKALNINPGDVLDKAASDARSYANELTDLQKNTPFDASQFHGVGGAMAQLRAKAGWKPKVTTAAYHDKNKKQESETPDD